MGIILIEASKIIGSEICCRFFPKIFLSTLMPAFLRFENCVHKRAVTLIPTQLNNICKRGEGGIKGGSLGVRG